MIETLLCMQHFHIMVKNMIKYNVSDIETESSKQNHIDMLKTKK